jgi:4'-phosphopantetheinyl transferase
MAGVELVIKQASIWQEPAALPPLGEDEVQVWRVDLEPGDVQARADLAGPLEDSLSPDERQRAERYRFAHLRRGYIAGRGALRHILGAHLGLPPAGVRFAYLPHGKPVLDGKSSARGLSFNLTNSHELALIAVTLGRPVGIDLEYRRSLADLDDLARRNFAPDEYQVFHGLPPEAAVEGFYRCWTRKEAFIKALGEGLSYPLEPARFIQIAGSREAAADWSLYDLPAGGEYTAALAVQAPAARLSFWQWQAMAL